MDIGYYNINSLVIIVDGANEKSFMIIAIATGVAIIFSNAFVHPLDESTHFLDHL